MSDNSMRSHACRSSTLPVWRDRDAHSLTPFPVSFIVPDGALSPSPREEMSTDRACPGNAHRRRHRTAPLRHDPA